MKFVMQPSVTKGIKLHTKQIYDTPTLHSSLLILHPPFFTLYPSTFSLTGEVGVWHRRNPSCPFQYLQLGYAALLGGVLVTCHNSEQILLLPIAEAVQEGGFFDLWPMSTWGRLWSSWSIKVISVEMVIFWFIENWTSLSFPKQSCFITHILCNFDI